uniref:Uncharacterized protein n=1 Tax=Cacopsylla melanoneura TaxID=428564 RepID=A0A8D8XLS6_9HEMI
MNGLLLVSLCVFGAALALPAVYRPTWLLESDGEVKEPLRAKRSPGGYGGSSGSPSSGSDSGSSGSSTGSSYGGSLGDSFGGHDDKEKHGLEHKDDHKSSGGSYEDKDKLEHKDDKYDHKDDKYEHKDDKYEHKGDKYEHKDEITVLPYTQPFYIMEHGNIAMIIEKMQMQRRTPKGSPLFVKYENICGLIFR